MDSTFLVVGKLSCFNEPIVSMNVYNALFNLLGIKKEIHLFGI